MCPHSPRHHIYALITTRQPEESLVGARAFRWAFFEWCASPLDRNRGARAAAAALQGDDGVGRARCLPRFHAVQAARVNTARELHAVGAAGLPLRMSRLAANTPLEAAEPVHIAHVLLHELSGRAKVLADAAGKMDG